MKYAKGKHIRQTEHPHASLDLFPAASERARADFNTPSSCGPSWEVERILLRAIINQIPELVYAKDTQGRFVAANDAAARDNGLQRAEELIGKTDFDLHPQDMAQHFFDIEQRVIASGQPMIDMEESRVDETGAPKWLLTTKVPMKDDRGEVVGLIGVARNITERIRAEQNWKAQRALFRAMIDQVEDYLFVKDTECRFTVANRAVAADLGLLPDDLIGKSDLELHKPDLARKFIADEKTVLSSGEPLLDIEEYVVDVAGNEKWLSTSKVPLHDDEGEIIGIVGISRDITDRRRSEERIRFMALHDSLTGLPNRSLLIDRLAQSMLQAQRGSGRAIVVFIDLDNFKLVNDSLGHKAGDTLLKVVADRMVKCVRASDTVARLGGDEFVILLTNQAEVEVGPLKVLEKIRAAIAEPVLIEGEPFHVTCSMGIATFPEEGQDAETLLKNADTAMYEAKANGRNNFQFYSERMNQAAHQRRLLPIHSLPTACWPK